MKLMGAGHCSFRNATQPENDVIFMPLESLIDLPVLNLAAFVREYDSKRELVFIFIDPAAGVSAYSGRMPERDMPPDAYRRLGRHLHLCCEPGQECFVNSELFKSQPAKACIANMV